MSASLKQYDRQVNVCFTLFTSDTADLCKTFQLDGSYKQGIISSADYKRETMPFSSLKDFLSQLSHAQAIALGEPEQPSGKITTKAQWDALGRPVDPIPRTKDHFWFSPGKPALVLLDVDGAGTAGANVLDILDSYIPGFDETAALIRPSSSAGIDTLNVNSTNAHIYIVISDGSMVKAFVQFVHKTLVINGFGRVAISKTGKPSIKSLIDPSVASPERIVYEADPIFPPGVERNASEPVYIPGSVYDVSKPLEASEVEYERASKKLLDDAAKDIQAARDAYTTAVASGRGITTEQAVQIVNNQFAGELDRDHPIYFNKNADPVRTGDLTEDHHGETCCDPLEPEYRNWHSTVAKIYVNDGSVVINSHAHGGTVYRVARDLTGVFGADVDMSQLSLTASATPLSESHKPEWNPPGVIENELSPVQPFDEKLLPSSIKSYTKDTAERMKVPLEYIAMPSIVVASSLIGTSCQVQPKRQDNWKVTPNLWGGVIGYPSDGKSPSLESVLNTSISPLEKEATEIHAKRLREFEIEDMIQSETQKHEKDELKKAIKAGTDIEGCKGNLLGMQKTEAPEKRRYRTNNATVEKIVEILAYNDRGLLVIRDELVGAFKKWDDNGDRPFILESWSGKSSFIDDKIGRGTTEAERLCLSIFGTIQPDRITDYLRGAISGYDNDGFLQRFQLLVFPDRVDWEYVDREPDTDAIEQISDIFHRLAHCDFNSKNTFHFNEVGQKLFEEWFIDLNTNKLKNTSDHPVLIEHLGKYRSLMPSLALIFHLMEIAPKWTRSTVEGVQSYLPTLGHEIISEGSVRTAIAWCELLESHARRIYGLATDIGTRAASILAGKLTTKKLQDGFSRRDVHRKGWKLLTDLNVIDQALDVLIDQNWIRELSTEGSPQTAGRPPSPRYEINPNIS